MDRHLLYGFSMALAFAGCAEAAPLVPSGGSCVRAVQCEPGLVCVLGQCITDLSGLEGGVAVIMDADMLDAEPVDGGDAGPVGVDTGPMVMRDAGPGMDAGPMMMRDAGPPPMMDAGTDAGPPPAMDAGTDAGTDAGPPPPADAGTDA